MKRREFIGDTAKGIIAASAVKNLSGGISEAASQQNSKEWYKNIYRQIIFDQHFGPYKKIYQNFDPDETAFSLREAGMQLVCYFAKCQDGYSYYPTNIGIVHPGLKRDYTGDMHTALKKQGIKSFAYVFMTMERKLNLEHPDWIYNPDSSGKIPDKNSIAASSMMCFRSPYTEEIVIPQMKEIAGRYDIDGFFDDIVVQHFLSNVCYCPSCREQFARDVGGEIPKSDDDPKAFEYRKWANRQLETHIEKIYKAVQDARPGTAVVTNYAWMSRYPVNPPSWVPHITWDTPTPKNGNFQLDFSFEGRYASNVPGVSFSTINVRGDNWSEYSLREPEALFQESALLLSACGRNYLSDISHPSGKTENAVIEIYTELNKRSMELEPFLNDAKPVKDVAILHSADSVWSKAPLKPSSSWVPAPAYHSVNGANKALVESHIQTSVLNGEVMLETLEEYKALILANQRILNEKECIAIKEFVSNGGFLFATSETGTRDNSNAKLGNFALADVLGVDFMGVSDTANCFLRFNKEVKKSGIPAMDIPVVGNYVRIRKTSAESLIELVPPYEGIKKGTPPAAEEPECPGITINSFGKGKAVYCSPGIFEAYYTESTPVLRKIVLWLLDYIYPADSRKISLENTPVNVEMFLNERGKDLFVHLLNYSGDKREVGIPQTQDFPFIHGIKVKLMTERKPKGIITVPESKTVPFEFKNGKTVFSAESLKIHSAYRIIPG